MQMITRKKEQTKEGLRLLLSQVSGKADLIFQRQKKVKLMVATAQTLEECQKEQLQLQQEEERLH